MTDGPVPGAAAFLDAVAEIGRDPRGGWSRLAYSRAEREAHELFARRMRDLGLSVRTDVVGNTYAELPGEEDCAPVVVGSHLDTVPQGGNFDGAVGVAAAVDVAARLVRQDAARRRPFVAVAFAAEEGARFGAPCIGSRVVTGAFEQEVLRELVDSEGRSVADCARELGLSPERADEAVWNPGDVAAFLEVHIEQGRVLEERGVPLAIVHSIAGSTRVELEFTGRADHSGATPMWLRRDALTGAAQFIGEVEHRGAIRSTSVATVGRVDVRPGSLTTIPGAVTLAMDVRDLDSEQQRGLVEDLLDEAVMIAGRRGLELQATLLSDQSPVLLHKTVQEHLVSAATKAGERFLLLPSGASHDAGHVARIVPTGMVFVPSRDGISHAPEEWSDVADVERAADVVAEAVARLDAVEVV